MKYKLHTNYKKLLADMHTPIGIYLKLRDKFPNSILLEGSDYRGGENNFSFICCVPIATFKVENDSISEHFPDGKTASSLINKNNSVADALKAFVEKFEPEKSEFKLIANGLFGFTSYDSAKYFEEVKITADRKNDKAIPDMIYSVYRYVIAIDHFKDELFLFENYLQHEKPSLTNLESYISSKSVAQFRFTLNGGEESNLRDEEYLALVRKGKEECKQGNLSQGVLSREFMQKFSGDEFNVYRSLRSINPSPYRFYFDYGNFKIFGSSPEDQQVVKSGVTGIHLNHAIIIRSFLSKNNTLYYRVGEDGVTDATGEKKLQEVNNKLGTLKLALTTAVEI